MHMSNNIDKELYLIFWLEYVSYYRIERARLCALLSASNKWVFKPLITDCSEYKRSNMIYLNSKYH